MLVLSSVNHAKMVCSHNKTVEDFCQEKTFKKENITVRR